MQFILRKPGDILRLADAIEVAPDPQVILALPQLKYVLMEIWRAVDGHRIEDYLPRQRVGAHSLDDTAYDVLKHVIDKVSDDARNAMRWCATNPGTSSRASYLAGVMSVLGEATFFTRAMASASGDPRHADLAFQVDLEWTNLASQVVKLRQGVGGYYPGLLDALPAPAELLRLAEATARMSFEHLPDLSQGKIVESHDDVMKDDVCQVIRDYHDSFEAQGFTRILRQVLVLAQAKASSAVENAVSPVLDTDLAQAYVRDYKERMGFRVTETEEQLLPEYIQMYERTRSEGKARSERCSQLAASMRGMLRTVAPLMAPGSGMSDARVLRFCMDERSGAVVGRFDDEGPHDSAIVTYPQPREDGWKDAVLVAFMPPARLDGGVPSLEEVLQERERPGGTIRATNYRSFLDLTTGLGNDRDVRMLLGSGDNMVLAGLEPGMVPRQPEAPVIAMGH